MAVLFLIGLEAAQGQLWTDLNGTRTVEARMIGLWGDSVILELAGGKRVAVKLDDLRSESRIQARKLAERLQSSRADRVQELQGNAAAASSAAPQPLPQPPAARPYQAPQQHLGVTEFVAQIDNAVSEGHLRAIYDALPPSYRKDVDDLVQLAASQLNQKSWQGLVGTAQRLGDVIVTHQNWFLSSPRIQALPPKDLDMVETQALSLAGVLRVGLSPDATNLNQLQTVSFGQWLTERDEAIAPYLAQLVNEIGIDVGRQVTVKSEKKETAIITVEQDGNQREIQLVSVDGYWVPKTIADQWSVNVDALKNDITDMTGMIDTLGLVVGSLNPALDPMANAQTSDQFHLAMNGLFSPTIQTAMITLATALGKTPTLASNQTAGGGNGGRGGYGDEDFEMGDEMGDEMAGGYGGSDPGRPGPGGPGSGGARPGPGGPGSGGARPGPGGPGSGGARPGPGGPGSGSGGVRPGPGGPESGGARPGPGGPESGGASLGELR